MKWCITQNRTHKVSIKPRIKNTITFTHLLNVKVTNACSDLKKNVDKRTFLPDNHLWAVSRHKKIEIGGDSQSIFEGKSLLSGRGRYKK